MYHIIARLFPGRMRNRYKNLLNYTDMQMDVEKFIIVSILIGIVGSFVISVNVFTLLLLSFNTFFVLFLVIFFVLEIAIYLWLILKADAKGKYIENILPDALMLMAMNLKSGMTTDRALIMAARSEFGPLERELNKTGKQILAGKDIKNALFDMGQRIRSRVLERTISLLVEGIRSGGELSALLQQLAEEMQTTKSVESEVRANVLMYAIFIFFAAGVGAPLLFGISTYLVGGVSQQLSTISVPESGITPISSGAITISPGFLITFAMIALTITSFFGGLIVGIVKKGEEKAGLKYIPMLLFLSLSIFFMVRGALAGIFPAISG